MKDAQSGPKPDAMLRLQGVAGAGPGRAAPGGRASGDPTAVPRVHLRLLATTDVHAQLTSFDYYAGRPQFGFGLAQTASLIAAARAGVPGSVLLDNGDFLQGSALADRAFLPRRRRPHPVIAAMNALGYDAAALGNHEFNYGLDHLMRALSGARFPVLSANVARRLGTRPDRDSLLVPAFAMIDRDLPDATGRLHRLRIGVIGLTPPQILEWDRMHLEGRLQVRPMVAALRGWLPSLRRAGADIVVCLAHTGITGTSNLPGGEGEALEIAAIDGIDAVVAGHSHLVFPGGDVPADPRIDAQAGRLCGKPAVQPGHSGSHLGVIDLMLDRRPDGGWTVRGSVARSDSASELVAGLPAPVIRRQAAALHAAVAADHRAALAWTRRPVGRTEIALTTYFAAAADLPAQHLIASAKVAHVRKRLHGRPEASLPILALASAFRSGGRGGPLNFSDIPAGPLSLRHIYDLYAFPNRLVARVLTGSQIQDLLEAAVGQYSRLVRGRADQLLAPRDVPGFAFTALPGADYQIDLSRPGWTGPADGPAPGQAGRICGLSVGAHRVAPSDRFVLVTNSYRAVGTTLAADAAPDLLAADPTLVTDAIVAYLQEIIQWTPERQRGRWSFAPLPGTSVLFDTGPGALAHLDDVAAMRPEFLGLTDTGFHRFRLHL